MILKNFSETHTHKTQINNTNKLEKQFKILMRNSTKRNHKKETNRNHGTK